MHGASIEPMTETIIGEWQQWQRAQGLSERTITERGQVLAHLASQADRDAFEIRPVDIIRYTGRPGLSQSSRATYHASIRAFYGWCQRVELRADNPADATPTPKRRRAAPRPLGSSQLAAVLAAANRRRTRMMVLLAALAGLRVHEIAKLRGDDFDWSAGVVTVAGKGGKVAMVPVHEAIAAAADGWPAAGWWFGAYDGGDGPIKPGAVSKAIGRAMERAGVAGTAHQLRHWYGTALLEQGEDLRTVQELMRHESVATTQIYTLVTSARRRAAIGRLATPAAA